MNLLGALIRSVVSISIVLIYTFSASAYVHAWAMNLAWIPAEMHKTVAADEGDCHTKTTASFVSRHEEIPAPAHDCYESCMGTYDELSGMKVLPKTVARTVAPIVSLQGFSFDIFTPAAEKTGEFAAQDPPLPVFETGVFEFHKILQKHE